MTRKDLLYHFVYMLTQNTANYNLLLTPPLYMWAPSTFE